MRVIMKGGPYDGEVRNAPTTQEDSRPIPYFSLPGPMSDIVTDIGLEKPFPSIANEMQYKLVEVWESGKFRRYEYHYQGR